ncbi:lipopolysaccharide transport periplasmic protein LptA [Duganella sp. sic0402]|uniref:lipopolysaccharide transport periplasmic protein LptA n=1 Tax=Duganella sp. sic0402 TaxID=2854786 RepID=UPI001C473997|nr:lipopolysaccharide transport periplasmic protein LptA [Duganella sp. sic0402]MBV7536704.1 lipopolysaccharide transport periplasmic protein LptA [Duganella sp. sic0402]
MKTLLTLAALCLPLCASAERADRYEKTVITYDGDMTHDTIKGISHFNDNVVLTKGSLRIASDTLVVSESPDGSHTYIVTGLPGHVAKFKQKLDSPDDKWIDGEGKVITYREKEDDLTIDGNAMVKVSEHGNVSEEANSASIIYDVRTEQFFAKSANNTTKVRSMLTISPRKDPLSK